MSRLITLSLLWLFVLGGLGAFFPFFSLYLRENAGLSGLQVGAVMSIPPLIGLFMQPLWGNVADRTGSRVRVLSLLALLSAAGYAGLGAAHGFATIALATCLLACFSVALIPSLVTVSLALVSDRRGVELGRVRVWGTVGFGLVVGTFPFVLDAWERWAPAVVAAAPASAVSEPGLGLMFWLSSGLLVVAALLSLSLPRGGVEAIRAARGDWRLLLRHGPFLRLLIFLFVGYLCLQGPMALFPILVRAQGGGLDAVSRMWLLMLALEIPLVAWLGASVARVGLRGVIAIGMAAGGLRWLVSGFADDLAWVTAVQILHGVVVWGVVLGAPLYVDRIVPERLRATGQGLLAMIGVSLGGFLSNLGSGWLIDHVGATAPAQIGGIGALALAALVPVVLVRPSRSALAS